MKPAIAMPMFDPKGNLFPNLRIILPQLKELFERAYISVSPGALSAQKEHVQWAAADPFFHVLTLPDGLPVGKEFALLYQQAAQCCQPKQILHLAFIDRVAFALQTEHAEQFCNDLQALSANDLPLCFLRSAAAWETHPKNYYDVEEMAVRAGELLLGKRLDYAWCHLVAEAQTVRHILPNVHSPSIPMMAEMILLLRDELQQREVDWLAWEDPFIEGVDAAALKRERESSRAEAQKRLAYVIPALKMISEAAKT